MKFSVLDYTDKILRGGPLSLILLPTNARISWSRVHSCGMWHHVQQNSFNMKSDNLEIFDFYHNKLHHWNREISGKC